MHWLLPLTARASSWTQGPQVVRQQEAEQSRVVQAPDWTTPDCSASCWRTPWGPRVQLEALAVKGKSQCTSS